MILPRTARFALTILGAGAVLLGDIQAVAAQVTAGPSPVSTVATPNPVSGRDRNSILTILPADVLARVNLVAAHLDVIRQTMGKPIDARPTLPVTNARPREVFFQALTMHRKADRLAFELTRTLDVTRSVPTGEIRPMHVFQMVDLALTRVLMIKEQLKLSDRIHERRVDDSTTPTDVFRAIVKINRQINLMLTQEFSPSDVYRQVTRAVHYTKALLGHLGRPSDGLQEPEFHPNKVPADVYRRLLSCFQEICALAKESGVTTLDLQVAGDVVSDVSPSDVYDVASMVVAELSFLHSMLDSPPMPTEAYHPGVKFPAHVFQRVGLLENQLAALRERVETRPDWLRK